MDHDDSSNSVAPDSPLAARSDNSPSEKVSGCSRPLDLSAKWTPPLEKDDDEDVLPASCGARQLSKLKRYLATVQQAAFDVSPETAEKVRQGIFALVNATVTPEQFQNQLHATMKLPTRPFVVSFIQASLPYLQRELIFFSRFAQENPHCLFIQHGETMSTTQNFWQLQASGTKKAGYDPSTTLHHATLDHFIFSPRDVTNTSIGYHEMMLFRQNLEQMQNIVCRIRSTVDSMVQWSAKEKETVMRNFSDNVSSTTANITTASKKLETRRNSVTKRAEETQQELVRLFAQLGHLVAGTNRLSSTIIASEGAQLKEMMEEIAYRLNLTTDRTFLHHHPAI